VRRQLGRQPGQLVAAHEVFAMGAEDHAGGLPGAPSRSETSMNCLMA
jgi:hypothetical protein